MTALTRIHGGKIPLITLDDRSGSGTPLTATADISAGTSRPATITDTGFVHDSYINGMGSSCGFCDIRVTQGLNRKKKSYSLTLGSPSRAMAAPSRKGSAE